MREFSSTTDAAPSTEIAAPETPAILPIADRKIAPGPNSFHAVRNGIKFLRDPFAVLDHCDKQYGPVVRFQLGSKGILHLIHQPEHVQHVLMTNNRNYQKETPYGILKALFGQGLLFNEGKSWFSQRRLLQPAFQAAHFSKMAEGTGEAILSVVDQWPPMKADQQTNIEDTMAKLSRRIVGEVLFGADLDDDINAIVAAETSKIGFILGNISGMPQNLRFKAAIVRLDKAIYRIIAERREMVRNGYSLDDAVDILSALMRAVDKDTGETMGDEQLRDELVTLLFSGFDTTSRTLTWVFHALSKNPAVEAKLHQELDEVLGGRNPTYADLAQMTYTEMLVKETLRVFPPNSVIGRQAQDDDTIGGYHIPAGSIITLCPYLTHHSPLLWEDPKVFEPLRFAPDQTQPRFNYFPFGGGPRQCIGKALAMMTIPMAIATIAQRYRFCDVPSFVVEHDIKVTLQSRRGVMATRETRSRQLVNA